MRHPPSALYARVLALATAIAQPERGAEDPDPLVAGNAMAELAALFHARQTSGEPDPFLTETLADFTEDTNEAVRLYRLAIAQCTGFPNEPVHTKRLALAERLITLGRTDEAREELNIAHGDASATGDADALEDIEALKHMAGR